MYDSGLGDHGDEVDVLRFYIELGEMLSEVPLVEKGLSAMVPVVWDLGKARHEPVPGAADDYHHLNVEVGSRSCGVPAFIVRFGGNLEALLR
jgi:hypothetical protein